ncbi:hypothetical protein ACJX0J_035305, partial [Zea mays]
ADISLCARCYVNNNYRPGLSPANFKRVEITKDAKPDWTDKETLHLLEAVLHYGEDWKKVSEHVSSRSEKDCTARFIRLPFGEQFMGHKEDRMRCYVNNNYRPGLSPANFKRVEITEDAKPDWTDKETLHLLEAVLHYGEDWKKVSEHVSSRSEKDCIARFIRLPFGEQFMGHKEDRMRFENTDDNTDEPGANVSKRLCLTPLADASNPIMAQSHPLDCAVATSGIDNTIKATEEYGDVDVFVANLRPLKATLSGLPDRVLMKILVCATSNKVVGVHMCGDDAPEIIQLWTPDANATSMVAGPELDFRVAIGLLWSIHQCEQFNRSCYDNIHQREQ